ncbi:MAG: hypothetical protein ACE5RL_00375 [Nitrosarchaeum sp.]
MLLPKSFSITWINDLNKLFMILLNYFSLCCDMLENTDESKSAWEEIRGLSWLILDDE